MNYKDILWRAGWTFVQAFAGAAFVSQAFSPNEALIAGLAGIASVIKNVAAQQLAK